MRLRPPEALAVSEAVDRYRGRIDGRVVEPWSFEAAPFLREPMDAFGRARVSRVVVMGPAQSGKSTIGDGAVMWTVTVDPADVIWIAPTREMTADYVRRRVQPLIRSTGAMAERQHDTVSSDNLFYKEFDGCSLTFAWPAGAQLRSRPFPRWIVDEFDAVPEDVDGQGAIIPLLEARQIAFEGRDVGLVISSPATAANRGIEAEWAKGSAKTWRWPCPTCGAWFAPDAMRDLTFARTASPDDAERGATVTCPANGCVIEQGAKRGMMARGRWVERDREVGPGGEPLGEASTSRVESYRIDGLMGFLSWGGLARRMREAELAFERRQDEMPLRAFVNTMAGANYTSRLRDMEPLALDDLKARREGGWRLGTVPPGVVFLTAAVDVQVNRFEVMVVGWGRHFESWIVDRFAIRQLDDGRTELKPPRYLEHWGVLIGRVFGRRWPLAADPTLTAPLLNVAIDTGGLDGTSANAAQFRRIARRRGVADRQIMTIKGGSNPRARLVPPPDMGDVTGAGDKRAKRGHKLFVLNVHGLKDIVAVRLRRGEPGPGYVHMPADLGEDYVEEIAAEEKTDAGWVRTGGPNETWDLAVYNLAAAIRWIGERAALARVPSWARVPAIGPAVAPAPDPAIADAVKPRRRTRFARARRR
ncbi:MAG: terminase gpA endonuclease subunit [Alphaproteobacteria bacterium]